MFTTAYITNPGLPIKFPKRIEEQVIAAALTVEPGLTGVITPSIDLSDYKYFSVHLYNHSSIDVNANSHEVVLSYYPNVEGISGGGFAPKLKIAGDTDKVVNSVLVTELREILGVLNFIRVFNTDTVKHTYKIKLVKYRW